ncbi:hypothetical protein HanXRQr2_Chr03g0108311 [Helianthus annuus]|uniref:Uncharacterized protein n=1 Tax=Helianthus annuus TaxID=4232 RepID=A0A251V6X0_HELAN|nr:hypothetical protein HanXRQr2_Chr03g0108311 [Helianthus annuus]
MIEEDDRKIVASSRRWPFRNNHLTRSLGLFSILFLARYFQVIAMQPMMRKSRFEEMNRMA